MARVVAGMSEGSRGVFSVVAKNRPRSRLFFAIFPDASTAQELARVASRLRLEYGLQGRPLPSERLHVTLQFLGDHVAIPEALVDLARSAANNVRLPPFEMIFDRVTSFYTGSHRRPLVLVASEGQSGALRLHEALCSALEDHVGRSSAASGRVYVPHLTLLYDPRQLEVSLPDPIGWTANEFFLVQSLIGQSKYIVLGHWMLSH